MMWPGHALTLLTRVASTVTTFTPFSALTVHSSNYLVILPCLTHFFVRVSVCLFVGVEAARAAIVNQIAGVFSVYGINVNRRHLGLIADYMVCSCRRIPVQRTHTFLVFV